MNKPSIVICMMVFLLLVTAILLICGLDETIGLTLKAEQAKKKKLKP